MTDVIITEFMNEDAVAELAESFDVLYDPDLVSDRERLADEIHHARALVVRNRTVVDAALLSEASSLRIVARLGVGLDNIDTVACSEREIEVAPAVGANAPSVAEFVIGSLLVLLRGVFTLTDRVSGGEWPRKDAVGRELMGRRLGLVGYGLIAREVASRATALGMTIRAHDPYLPEDDEAWQTADRSTLDGLMSSCDAVSIHVPLTDSTAGLIDDKLIGLMPPGSVLVNTSRGGIVEEDAVIAALKSGHLGGAALDVFAVEPVEPAYGARFTDAPNLILSPHVAGITEESEVRIGAMTIASIRRVLGSPP